MVVAIGPGMRDRRNGAGVMVVLGGAGAGGTGAGGIALSPAGKVVGKSAGTVRQSGGICCPGVDAPAAYSHFFALFRSL